MKELYRESEKFHLEHRGRKLFTDWLRKTRHQRRMTNLVNERLSRVQRNILR